MLKNLIACFKRIGRRRRAACVLPLGALVALMLVSARWLGPRAGRALLPPPPPDQDLGHFRRSRDLEHYFNHIELLLEPASVCTGAAPLVVLVSSAPPHEEQRLAIRRTWGRHLRTYFVLGSPGASLQDTLADIYVEAKQHSDMIVYDLHDHYQNLTLKTMLMLQWTQRRCPHVEYVFKTDDDVLVNPWTLQAVLEDHRVYKAGPGKRHMIGYRILEARAHRDEYSKWFAPRWLLREGLLPEYLSGTGYLLPGDVLEATLSAAKKVPLINLEDVYLTYLVLKKSLNYELVDDRRLSPFRPWLPWGCAFWSLASMHSFKPDELLHAWAKIETIRKQVEKEKETCSFYRNYFDSDVFLY